ncbi:uncharacterized protein N7483_004681 [Penicillium malachiteum]|uniref:uncharacterized protein n=1 Tax=Penicillium malachiteum TaxID=1324776 RepID=UPI0025481087|nr:uncharacterized protein N7483_004681 [Penicillium malachiteum]KAJ5730173.1 hypothetical protein N7483_004681 [Penicillium malachiteum]
MILQHSNINTFVRYYQVDVNVDVQGIIRKTGSQTHLVRFACLFSVSIDLDRPFKLSPKESLSLDKLPVILARQEKVNKRKRNYKQKLQLITEQTIESKERYDISIRDLRNKKQQQRNQQIRENLEQYRNEQPVINLKRQLTGKLVNTKVIDTLEHKTSITSQHLALINTILTIPGATLEEEINTINAITVFCSVEEGRPTPRTRQSYRRPLSGDGDDNSSDTPIKQQRCVLEDITKITLRQAMESVRVKDLKERPTICFLYLGNPNLPLMERIAKHATPGSLTRHFLRKHINPPWPAKGLECNICRMELLEQRADLLNHTELCHGTVVRGKAQEKLGQECQKVRSALY